MMLWKMLLDCKCDYALTKQKDVVLVHIYNHTVIIILAHWDLLIPGMVYGIYGIIYMVFKSPL